MNSSNTLKIFEYDDSWISDRFSNKNYQEKSKETDAQAEKISKQDIKAIDPLNDEEYYMAIALLSRLHDQSSTDSEGTCIVGSHGRIVATGHTRITPLDGIYMSTNTHLPTRGLFTKSAQQIQNEEGSDVNDIALTACKQSAIFDAILNVDNLKIFDCATVYLTNFPSLEDAKILAKVNIFEIVYLKGGSSKNKNELAAKKFLEANNIGYKHYKGRYIDLV